jgi:hypothetical protein
MQNALTLDGKGRYRTLMGFPHRWPTSSTRLSMSWTLLRPKSLRISLATACVSRKMAS